MRTVRSRFEDKYTIDSFSGCWNWLGSRTTDGYGMIFFGRIDGRCRNVLAHRLSYELHVGPIPSGLTIDHLCRNRACVNFNHLEPVPLRINILRGETLAAQNVKKTHCPQNHEYSLENTYISKKGKKDCITCHNERTKKANRDVVMNELILPPHSFVRRLHCRNCRLEHNKNYAANWRRLKSRKVNTAHVQS